MKAGWKIKNLGDLCRIRTGKKDVNEGNPAGKFPFFTCAAEHTFSDNYSFDTEALLIAGNGDVGKVSYYNGKFEAYQRTYVLSDFTEVLPRFLFLILDGKLKDTVSKQKLGNTMPYIKVGMLTDFQLPVPPLAEQERIVGVLDEAFAGLATAQAHAEQNRKNARALFDSHLHAVFSQRGWPIIRLGDLAEMVTKGTTPTSVGHSFVPNGINFVKVESITKTGRFIEEKFAHITADCHADLGRSQLAEGDILFSIAGALGRTALVTSDMLPANTNQALAIIRLKPNPDLLSKFVLKALETGVVLEQIEQFKGGVAQQNLSLAQVRDFQIAQPPIAEQQQIVAKLDALAAETQRLAGLYEQKLAALAALKKSLLHQAFSGAL
jgi:type I restriction enzyme S subunit